MQKANKRLSESRAKSVVSALQKFEIPADIKLVPIGFGDTRAAASNETEAGRALNRRVEIIIEM